MPGGDFAFAIAGTLTLLVVGAELLIRAVEGLIAGAGGDPHAVAQGDVPAPIDDELERLRNGAAL
jgi:hypothetical protein